MITSSLLNGVSGYVNGRIAKVVINGEFEITSFKVKEVTDNVVALNYIVPVADVNVVSLIELKDSKNQVLTSNTVNIPIAADQMMLHTITVKEAG
ncbi:ketopantoate hydroxymethyltransferase [Paenibacillus septentrionalis]|uniref:Ketopantoate hydroxymethyltransferase n=1 Tax=Paenibacillus septentrionalis TaxID=429342 RepID=A0ABW1V9U8_9BACL